MPFGSPKETVVGSQEDFRSTTLGAGQVQRIEVPEPQRLQLCAAHNIGFLYLHPAGDIRKHLPDAAEPFLIEHPPDLEL